MPVEHGSGSIATPKTCLSANLTHEQRETIAPAARTAMPDLQLGIWIDAKRRERAYEATG